MSRRRLRTLSSPLPAIDLPGAALLAALVAVPGYFNIQSNMSFEPDKGAILRTLAFLALLPIVVEIWQHWRQKSLRAWSLATAGDSGLPLVLLAGVVGVTGLATLLSVDPVTSLWGGYERGYGWLAVLAGAIMVVVAYRTAQAGHVWLMVDAALLGAMVPAFYGLLQYLGYDPVRAQTVSFVLGQRASSSLGNPLFLADYLLVALLLGLARLFAGPALSPGRRAGLIAALVIMTAAFAATGSRSALFAAIAAVVFMILAEGRRLQARWVQGAALLVLAAGGVLLGVAWAAPQVLPPRLGDLFASGGSGGQRLLIWQAVLALVGQTPRYLVVGVGPDALPLKLAPFLPAQLAHFEVDWVFRIPDRAHTYALDLLAQAGLAGLLVWSLFWAAVFARVLPRSAAGRPAVLPILFQLGGALLLAAAGWLLAGAQAAPLGYMAGFLGGGILVLLITPVGKEAPARPASMLSSFLLAALAGHWLLLAFSFSTHAADLLLWVVVGLALAGGGEADAPPQPAARRRTVFHLAGIAAAVIGFSLSAAMPPALVLWLSLLLLIYVVATSLAAGAADWGGDLTGLLLPVVTMLPALWLNRSPGLPAWLAYAWFVIWLAAQVVLVLAAPQRRPALPIAAVSLACAVVLTLPILGDIAFKSAVLQPDDAAAREQSLQRALWLSPYDHVVAAGIVPTEALSLSADASLDDPVSRRIQALYARAEAAQPLAPETPAAYAEWLRRRSLVDPSAAPLARAQYERALQLSPNDIQTRNGRALLAAASGDTATASAQLRALWTLDPLYGPTYLNLARLQQQEGDAVGARRTLAEGVAQVPWWPELRRALDELP